MAMDGEKAEVDLAFNQRSFVSTMLSRIRDNQLTGLFCDLTLRCMDGEVATSSLIFASISPMIYSVLLKTPQFDGVWIVDLPDTLKRDIETLILTFFTPCNENVKVCIESSPVKDAFSLLRISQFGSYTFSGLTKDITGKEILNTTLRSFEETQVIFKCDEKINVLKSNDKGQQQSVSDFVSGDTEINIGDVVTYFDSNEYFEMNNGDILTICGREDSENKPRCNKKMTKNSQNVELNEMDILREKLFECDESTCQKIFNTKSELKSHLQTHSPQVKDHVCSHCGSTFTSKGSLDMHTMRIHVNSRNWPCPIVGCNKMFKTPGEVKQHQKTHSNTKNFVCWECGSAYVSKQQLNIHIKMNHTVSPDGLFHCDQCGKAFKSPLELRTHDQKTHSVPEKRFRCDICGKAFSVLCNLKRHLMVHNDERPFGCLDCGARFRTNYHFQKHTKTHGSGLLKRSQMKANCRKSSQSTFAPSVLVVQTNDTEAQY